MTLQNFFSGLIQIEVNCFWDVWNWVVYWFYAKSGINVKVLCIGKVFVKWVSEMYH